jgi:hypothetical protein
LTVKRCKICQSPVAKLVKCHIYPDAFTRHVGGEHRQLVGMAVRDGAPWVSHAGNGMFDPDIACPDCELRFHWADDYAIGFWRQVLRLEGEFQYPNTMGGTMLPIFKADGARLHAFAMNTLYRAYLSDRWEYDRVVDPSIAQLVRPTLFGQGRTIDSGPAVALVFTRGELGGLVMAPWLMGENGHLTYLLQMPHLSIYVAASEHGLPSAIGAIALNDTGTVQVYRRRRPERFELDRAGEVLRLTNDRVQRVMSRPRNRKAP